MEEIARKHTTDVKNSQRHEPMSYNTTKTGVYVLEVPLPAASPIRNTWPGVTLQSHDKMVDKVKSNFKYKYTGI